MRVTTVELPTIGGLGVKYLCGFLKNCHKYCRINDDEIVKQFLRGTCALQRVTAKMTIASGKS